MAVVVTGNIVRMACYLVVSLAAVAGLFFLAGADFLGAVQLMVYVGGTMVLLVFGVMLTARGPVRLDEDRRRAMDPGDRSSAARCWPCCCKRRSACPDWSDRRSAGRSQGRRGATPHGHARSGLG